MGLASFTVNGRPSSCEPLRVAMALSAPSSSMTTNPNPFERPESRSVMILTDSTVPHCVNVSVMEISVVWNDKFPTYNFFDIVVPEVCKGTSELIGGGLKSIGARGGQGGPKIGCAALLTPSPAQAFIQECSLHAGIYRPPRPKRRPLGFFRPKLRHL